MQLAIRKENYLPHQYQFLLSGAKALSLVCGYGAGKTYVFLRKTLIHHLFSKRTNSNKSSGWVLYPTIPLARELFIDEFMALVEELDIDYTWNQQQGIFKTKYGVIKVYTLERPERLVGSNLTFVGVDEFDTTSPNKGLKAYEKVLGRLRGKEGAQLYIVTTPEGFLTTYKIFVENKNDEKEIIHASSYDNPYLPEGYIEQLEREYDPKLLKAYLHGQFVNLKSGSVYYTFDREKHVLKEEKPINPNYPLNICFDFNIFPYSVSWNQILNDENVIWIGEWVSSVHSNTFEACDEIMKLLPNDIAVNIYGDATGRNGAANSNKSNYEIINEKFSNYFREVSFKVPSSNPAVKDRINCFNGKLSKGHVRFNPSCKKLIQDLEQVVWDKNSRDLDKSDIHRTHSSDGAGYFMCVEYPITDFKKLRTRML